VTKALAVERRLSGTSQTATTGGALPLQRDQKRPPHATLSAASLTPRIRRSFFIEAPLNPADRSPD